MAFLSMFSVDRPLSYGLRLPWDPTSLAHFPKEPILKPVWESSSSEDIDSLHHAISSSPSMAQHFFADNPFPWPYKREDAAFWVGHNERRQVEMWSAGPVDFPTEDLFLPIVAQTLARGETDWLARGSPEQAGSVVGQVGVEIRTENKSGSTSTFVVEADRAAGSKTLWLVYMVSELHSGKGVATRAVGELSRFVFLAFPGVERLYLRCFANNTGSVRVAQKAGFKHLGKIPKGEMRRHEDAVQQAAGQLKESDPVEVFVLEREGFFGGLGASAVDADHLDSSFLASTTSAANAAISNIVPNPQ